MDEIPKFISGFSYIAMLTSNQTPLEVQLSAMRSSGHDSANDYGGEIMNKTIKQYQASLAHGSSYCAGDGVKETDVFVSGSTLFKKQAKETDSKIEQWKIVDYSQIRVDVIPLHLDLKLIVFSLKKLNFWIMQPKSSLAA